MFLGDLVSLERNVCSFPYCKGSPLTLKPCLSKARFHHYGKVTTTTLLKFASQRGRGPGGAGYVGCEQGEICFAVLETVGQRILGFVGTLKNANSS